MPYVLSSAYTQVQRAILARSMAAYSGFAFRIISFNNHCFIAKTCIRFAPKEPSDRDYIVISKLDG